MIGDRLEPLAVLVGTARTRLADRGRKLRGRGWEVHRAAKAGHVVICRPGCWRSRTVTIDHRDVQRVFLSFEPPAHEGWCISGSPGKARVRFTDGTAETFPVSARLLAQTLSAARDADAGPARPSKATTVDVRIGDVKLGTLTGHAVSTDDARRVV